MGERVYEPYRMTPEELVAEREQLEPAIHALEAEGDLGYIFVLAPEVRPWGREALVLLGPRYPLFSLEPEGRGLSDVTVETMRQAYRHIAARSGLVYDTDVDLISGERLADTRLTFPQLVNDLRSIRVVGYPDSVIAAGAQSAQCGSTHFYDSYGRPVYRKPYYFHDMSSVVTVHTDTITPWLEGASGLDMFLLHDIHNHDLEFIDGPRNA